MGEEAFHFAKTTHLQFNRKAEFHTIPTFKPIFSVGRDLDTFPREIDPSESYFAKKLFGWDDFSRQTTLF